MSCCEPSVPTRTTTTTAAIAIASSPPFHIRPAGASDGPAIEHLLAALALPTAGLDDAEVLIAEDLPERHLIATVGLETWGRHGLLRSLAVVSEHRRRGLGRTLAAAVVDLARQRNLHSLALLTTAAAPFFERLGFTRRDRDQAPPALRASRQWRESVCPASSLLLIRDLRAPITAADTHALVEQRYAAVASGGATCCNDDRCRTSADRGYSREELSALPPGTDLGLGCGAPLAAAAVKPGETVLDLGSGGGLDALLAARAVGPSGRVIGVDMTAEMIVRAEAAAARAGAGNVEFRRGKIEHLPVADSSVDLVLSNCVINLSADKPAVFREAFRVLRPGGRMVIADIVSDGDLPEAVRNDPALYCGCVGGAWSRDRYLAAITAAGFATVQVLKDVAYDGFPGVAVRSLTYRAEKAGAAEAR